MAARLPTGISPRVAIIGWQAAVGNYQHTTPTALVAVHQLPPVRRKRIPSLRNRQWWQRTTAQRTRWRQRLKSTLKSMADKPMKTTAQVNAHTKGPKSSTLTETPATTLRSQSLRNTHVRHSPIPTQHVPIPGIWF